jgi:hypothetical protein
VLPLVGFTLTLLAEFRVSKVGGYATSATSTANQAYAFNYLGWCGGNPPQRAYSMAFQKSDSGMLDRLTDAARKLNSDDC